MQSDTKSWALNLHYKRKLIPLNKADTDGTLETAEEQSLFLIDLQSINPGCIY